MKSITIVIFVSLIIVSQIYGHKIHKRLLEKSKEPSSNETKLLNKTNLEAPTKIITTMPTLTLISKDPKMEAQIFTDPKIESSTQMQNWSMISSTEALDTLAHPYVEATDVHHSNESDIKIPLEAPIVEKLPTENPHESNDKNSSAPGDTLPVLSTPSKPLQIIRENCTCFSIRRPSSMKNSKKFENSTTSILSEVESEIGILFEIAAGVLPKVNDIIERTGNETSQINGSEIIEIRNDESQSSPQFFEDFLPFFPLESLLARAMPQETIIIQSESDLGDPSKAVLPKLGDDFVRNGNDSNKNKEQNDGKKEVLNLTTQKNDKEDDKKSIST